MDEVNPHHGIGVEETARVLSVGSDAPDHRGGVNDILGAGVFERGTNTSRVGQIVVGRWDYDRRGSSLLEVGNNPTPKEASSRRSPSLACRLDPCASLQGD